MNGYNGITGKKTSITSGFVMCYIYIYIYIYKRLKWFVKQHQVHKAK